MSAVHGARTAAAKLEIMDSFAFDDISAFLASDRVPDNFRHNQSLFSAFLIFSTGVCTETRQWDSVLLQNRVFSRPASSTYSRIYEIHRLLQSSARTLLIRSQVSSKLVPSRFQDSLVFWIIWTQPPCGTCCSFAESLPAFTQFSHQNADLVSIKPRQNLLQFFERSTNFVILPDVLTEFHNQKVALLSRVSFLCFQSGISIVRNA